MARSIGVVKILYLHPVNNGVPPVNPDSRPLMQRRFAQAELRTSATNNRGAHCSNEFSDLRGAPVHKSDVFSANEWLDLYPRATFGRGPQFLSR